MRVEVARRRRRRRRRGRRHRQGRADRPDRRRQGLDRSRSRTSSGSAPASAASTRCDADGPTIDRTSAAASQPAAVTTAGRWPSRRLTLGGRSGSSGPAPAARLTPGRPPPAGPGCDGAGWSEATGGRRGPRASRWSRSAATARGDAGAGQRPRPRAAARRPAARPTAVAALAERLWYPLWDAGLRLDHSVRTADAVPRGRRRRTCRPRSGCSTCARVAGDAGAGRRAPAPRCSTTGAAAPARRLPAAPASRWRGAAPSGSASWPTCSSPTSRSPAAGCATSPSCGRWPPAWVTDRPHGAVDEAHARAARRPRRPARGDRPRPATGCCWPEQDAVAAALRPARRRRRCSPTVSDAGRTIAYAVDTTVRRAAAGRSAPAPAAARARAGRGCARSGTAWSSTTARWSSAPARRPGRRTRCCCCGRPRPPPGPACRSRRPPSSDLAAGLPAAARRRGRAAARDALRRRCSAAGPGAGPGLGGARPGRADRAPGSRSGRRSAAGRSATPCTGTPSTGTWSRPWSEAAALPARRRPARPAAARRAAARHRQGPAPRDHTAVGRAAGRRGGRAGWASPPADVDGRRARWSASTSLLVELATRRDPDDPRDRRRRWSPRSTAARDLLDLLRALTEADALATGPAAWTDWRARLVDDLVDAGPGGAARRGRRPARPPLGPARGGAGRLGRSPTAGRGWRSRAAGRAARGHRGRRRTGPGLLADIAGVLAAYRLTVRSALVRTVGRPTAATWPWTPGGWTPAASRPTPAALRDRRCAGSAEGDRSRAAAAGAGATPATGAPRGTPAAGRGSVVRPGRVGGRDRARGPGAPTGPGCCTHRRGAGRRSAWTCGRAHIATHAGQAVDVFYVAEPGGAAARPAAGRRQAVAALLDAGAARRPPADARRVPG